MKTTLRMTARQHLSLLEHLFPGDGNEAVAVALCGRRASADHHVLTVHQVYVIPYESCRLRNPVRVEWNTDVLLPVVAKAAKQNMALVKFHSHPGGYENFSDLDDVSDRELMSSIFGWSDSDDPHGSVVMLPGGEMFGRTVHVDSSFGEIENIAVVGDEIRFCRAVDDTSEPISVRTEQTFGVGTTNLLKKLKIAVVGCSGTGSLVIEQLARYQVGRLLLVDDDVVEDKNLTRIPNAFRVDADNKTPKVRVFEDAINRMGLGTKVIPLSKNLVDREAMKQVADCDIIFGCMDGVEGRHYANLIASFYCLPYFDLGVRIDADGQGGVTQVCGSVHYLQPGGSSLLTRGVYTLEDLRAEGLRRTNPELYKQQVKEKYLKGVNEDRPAVISVNMLIASLAVNEMLARLHPIRTDDNSGYAIIRVSLTDSYIMYERDGTPDAYLAKFCGRGDITPLLNRADLDETTV